MVEFAQEGTNSCACDCVSEVGSEESFSGVIASEFADDADQGTGGCDDGEGGEGEEECAAEECEGVDLGEVVHFFSRKSGGRFSKSADPTRMTVAPSWTATSKSLVIPMESSWQSSWTAPVSRSL